MKDRQDLVRGARELEKNRVRGKAYEEAWGDWVEKGAIAHGIS